jgi:hypothetical protein
MERIFLLQSYTEAKEFEKAKKSDGYGGCFSFTASVLLLFRFSNNQLQFKKAKEMLKWD